MDSADLRAHDLNAALAGVVAKPVGSAEEDAAAFPRLASFAFSQGAVHVGRFNGETPWECHPDADELLHALEGEMTITLLTSPAPTVIQVPAGRVLVVPRGIWHRQWAPGSVTLLAVTPDQSLISFAADPRDPEADGKADEP